MSFLEVLRFVGPLAAAAGAAFLVDRGARRRRLDPPGFASPARRALGLTLVAFTMYVAVFAALGAVGRSVETDLDALSNWQLFALQALFVVTILGWFALGFAGTAIEVGGEAASRRSLVRRFADQLGFSTPNPLKEVGIGVVAGIAAWILVLLGAALFAVALASFAGEEMLPQAPPSVIPWIAGQSILLRLMIALTAGVVEETFFRGFLQPRIGIVLSTACFALAHLSYDQPIMLVGITILSLFYGLLVKWRQNLLPAIVAHFLFDAIQLLIVIPAVLQLFFTAEP